MAAPGPRAEEHGGGRRGRRAGRPARPRECRAGGRASTEPQPSERTSTEALRCDGQPGSETAPLPTRKDRSPGGGSAGGRGGALRRPTGGVARVAMAAEMTVWPKWYEAAAVGNEAAVVGGRPGRPVEVVWQEFPPKAEEGVPGGARGRDQRPGADQVLSSGRTDQGLEAASVPGARRAWGWEPQSGGPEAAGGGRSGPEEDGGGGMEGQSRMPHPYRPT